MSDLPPPPPDDSYSSSPPAPPPGGDAYSGPIAATGWATTGTGESVQLASPGARLGARILDLLIFGVAFVVLSVLGVATAVTGGSDPDDAAALLAGTFVMVLLTVAISLLYEVTMIATRGQTLGKMATSIKVVRADNGLVPGWGKSIGRWIIPALLLIIPFVGWILSLLVYISLLWDRTRQGWHDKAAGTLVVKA